MTSDQQHDPAERCIECATDEEIATAWARSGPHPTIRFDAVTCPREEPA